MTYGIRITYLTNFAPTAIEWLLLEVINRYSKNKTYQKEDLKTILRASFQIEDFEGLILPVLTGLYEKGMILFPKKKEALLEDYRLTEKGLKAKEKGEMPFEKTVDIELYYDFNERKWHREFFKTENPPFEKIKHIRPDFDRLKAFLSGDFENIQNMKLLYVRPMLLKEESLNPFQILKEEHE